MSLYGYAIISVLILTTVIIKPELLNTMTMRGLWRDEGEEDEALEHPLQ